MVGIRTQVVIALIATASFFDEERGEKDIVESRTGIRRNEDFVASDKRTTDKRTTEYLTQKNHLL